MAAGGNHYRPRVGPDLHDRLAKGADQLGQFVTGRIAPEFANYGLELGGPLLRDRLWMWGSYASTDVDLLAIGRENGQDAIRELSIWTAIPIWTLT